ncbi:MAG: helix-turn-helix transcriptional regulator [Butyrivibrio sp.]|nr:helix-turn-helix transcriptional regulator [Butyrivibrio sp.]
MLSALLSVFFVELLRFHEKDLEIPSMSRMALSDNIVFILEYMQKNYTTITLSHLSTFFNYSERQMQRIIESATGTSFSNNIKKLRMNKAAELLTTTNMTVSEIADSLGFYDCSSFRQSFKKYYGCSPRKFK